MNKDKINSLQLVSMMSMMMLASFLGMGMFSVVKSAGVDSYISIIIAGVAGIFILLSFFVIYDYEPDLNIAEKFKNVFGKTIGNILNLICIITVLTIGISAMFNLTTFITSQFLKETPIFFIGIFFAIIIIIANIKGIETLSRTCLILWALSFILFVISIIGLAPAVEISNLKPVLEFGINKPIKGAIYVFLLNLLPIYLLLVIPKNSLVDKDKYRKYMYGFYTLSILLIFILVIVTLGVLGINLARIYQYPEYMVMKTIKIFNFIDRIENVITIQWLFGLFFNISFVVYYITHSIKSKYKGKALPIFLTALILFCSIVLFKNNTKFNEYTYKIVPYIRIIILTLYIILLIGILFKKKFRKNIN